ncbi:MAG: helix-turn-helix domain-containing protein [Phycisphaerales bacterium]
MVQQAPLSTLFDGRRRELGMTFPALAERSGVSEPTVKRILGGRAPDASIANVAAVAGALGVTLGLHEEVDAHEMCRREARRKAEQVARLVQGTSALESQAVDAKTYRRLVEESYHELLAGPRRRLWAP